MTTMKSCSVDLDGPVHYADFGGTGRPILLIHGLGGSHLNWAAVGPRLAAHGHVMAMDLAGHGHTRAPRGASRVGQNRRLIDRFLERLAPEPAILVGNSMGGYLSIAEAAASPERIAALVLVDPALPLARGVKIDRTVLALFTACALPGIGGAVMRLRFRRTPEQMVHDMFELCCSDPALVPRDVYQAHVDLARARLAYGRVTGREFLAAQRSLMSCLFRRRRFREMVASVRAPALVVQGDRDRLVNVAAARALAAARPDWRLEVIEGVGHVPQLEVPERFLAVVEPWIDALPGSPRPPAEAQQRLPVTA